ncbi:hypothetical protein GLOIN_2v1848653 [Rhizophagus irregularis DAOM 181602=DAOM 197198]|nr:hypothetical protein GLOIN_2v1848653 [Rhizophagus irregularis DAOM 181602=DAOM 197198]GBC28361.2 hypothetical protein GLOIN_2v1848653 [Rhizophagus irregularis DAOM 181602=DAOM 197198]
MDSLRSLKIPIIQLQKSILPYNFDSGEQPETEQPATDKQEPLVLIISPMSGNEEQDHGQDDQVKVLDTNTDDANEDFCLTQKNDKKRTKIDTSMRKRAKPDEKILLAINKIGGPTIDSLLYSLSKLKNTGVKSVTMNLVNNNIRFMDSTGTLVIKPNHVNSDDITINASYIGKLPNNPPIRDRSIFSKKEEYREALISHLEKINSTQDFQSFRGTQQKTSSLTELSDEFKKIAKDLSEDIFLSVMGEANEQGNKEMARRKELRKQSETTKSQAKILIAQFYPLISLPNLELMLHACFFKSGVKMAINFEIWINLVRTGKLISYDEELKTQERNRENKRIKIEIIKEYFDISGVNFDEMVGNE